MHTCATIIHRAYVRKAGKPFHFDWDRINACPYDYPLLSLLFLSKNSNRNLCRKKNKRHLEPSHQPNLVITEINYYR